MTCYLLHMKNEFKERFHENNSLKTFTTQRRFYTDWFTQKEKQERHQVIFAVRRSSEFYKLNFVTWGNEEERVTSQLPSNKSIIYKKTASNSFRGDK